MFFKSPNMFPMNRNYWAEHLNKSTLQELVFVLLTSLSAPFDTSACRTCQWSWMIKIIINKQGVAMGQEQCKVEADAKPNMFKHVTTGRPTCCNMSFITSFIGFIVLRQTIDLFCFFSLKGLERIYTQCQIKHDRH